MRKFFTVIISAFVFSFAVIFLPLKTFTADAKNIVKTVVDFSENPTLKIVLNGKETTFSGVEIGENNGFYLKGINDVLERFRLDNSTQKLDAFATFSKDGFTYFCERTGYEIDGEKLKEDVINSLKNAKKNDTVYVMANAVKKEPEIKLENVKKYTEKIASFTTYFNGGDTFRSSNICLASKFLDGITLYPNEVLSFNSAVGKRTEERGFLPAKIISGGKFVYGVGGGVCQVSTTLYNAALISGLKVEKRSPHSLAVSYVSPSKDAMVSDYSDLKIRNVFTYPVYLSVKTGKNYVTATFYGKKTDYEYKFVSETVKEILPENISIADDETVVGEKKGYESKSYLEKYFKGALIERKLISLDNYSAINGKAVKKSDISTN